MPVVTMPRDQIMDRKVHGKVFYGWIPIYAREAACNRQYTHPRTMKPMINMTVPALVTMVALTLPGVSQETKRETVRETKEDARGNRTVSETTTTGTINEFGDNRIVVRTESSANPVTYSFTKSTTYVDEAGAPVSIETVKSGLPVTVHYVKEGDRMVAQRVVVRKTKTRVAGETTETKTTTTTGTINEFGDDRIVIRSETSKDPLRYRFTKSTTYVDEEGNPFSVKEIKSGLPVTVHYTRDGDAMVASKVIVRKSTTVTPR
jgi:hypothetical protein